jgi:hypothetical protein
MQLVTHTPLWQNAAPAPHTCPHCPQLAGSFVSDRHEPLQALVPAGQAHAPLRHDNPAPQTLPHAPQFCGSLAVNVQPEAQAA